MVNTDFLFDYAEYLKFCNINPQKIEAILNTYKQGYYTLFEAMEALFAEHKKLFSYLYE